MKKLTAAISLLLLLSSASVAIAGDLRLGAKVGYLELDYQNLDDEKGFLSTNVHIGYEFMQLGSLTLAAQVDFASSLTDGKAVNDDFSYEGIGASVSVRTQGNVYFIGQIGGLSVKTDFEDRPSTDDINDTASVISAGIGFGKETRREITLDAFSYSDDHSGLMVSFGLNF